MKHAYFVFFFLCLHPTFLWSNSHRVRNTNHVSVSDTYAVLYDFYSNGYDSVGNLIFDSMGNIYGTAAAGGLISQNCSFNCGIVFKLSPSEGGWKFEILYSFTGGADGGEPHSRLTLDSKGNLYGTTYVGGNVDEMNCPIGCGTVFELSLSGDGWNFALLHSFTGSDGSAPWTGLTPDNVGNLYGTTTAGGSGGAGTVFELSLSDGSWTFSTIHALVNSGSEGEFPSSDLVIDASGNIYGAAQQGGSSESSCSNFCGTLFELSPSGGTWQFTLPHAFLGAKQGDGGLPWGSLTLDASGNVYGTTFEGGASDRGAVFELSESGGTWNEQILYGFSGGSDGEGPFGGVIIDKTGKLYGTTSYGGTIDCGTIFELSPELNGSGWNLTSLYSFTDGADGGRPYAGVIADVSGNLYGTTTIGEFGGTLFQLSFLSATTTTLSASPNTSAFGQSVAFAATVTSLGSGTPTGSVAFSDGSTTLGSLPLSVGTATFSTAALAVGTHSIGAVYSGDSNCDGSSASLNQTVNQASTTMTLGSSINPSGMDSPVTFTATITPRYGGQASGTVTFKDGGTTLGSGTVGGNASSLTTSVLAIGTHSISAVYVGDSNFAGSASNSR